jgi:hypothetical protein
MGNTIDYPVDHPSPSNTRHVVDALQIGMIASALTGDRTCSDLQLFVEKTAASYNRHYHRKCMFNVRNEKTHKTRGIIVDLAATPKFHELPLCVDVWAGLRQRIVLSSGDVVVISRLDDEDGMRNNSYKLHVALVDASSEGVKTYNIMTSSLISEFRCFQMTESSMMIMVTKYRTMLTPTTFFLYTYKFGEEQTAFYTTIKIDTSYDCPIIHVSGERFVFVKNACEGEEWYEGRLTPRAIISKEIIATRGDETWMFGAQIAPTKFLMFTTYNYPSNTTVYVDLLDIPTWTWQTIHTFSGEIMEKLTCY